MIHERTFSQWDYKTKREAEDLCVALPVLTRAQAEALFQTVFHAVNSSSHPKERQRGAVFDSLMGVVAASERQDFSVMWSDSPGTTMRGLLRLRTSDSVIPTVFCVARVSHDRFLTYGFSSPESVAAVDALLKGAPDPGTSAATAESSYGGNAGSASADTSSAAADPSRESGVAELERLLTPSVRGEVRAIAERMAAQRQDDERSRAIVASNMKKLEESTAEVARDADASILCKALGSPSDTGYRSMIVKVDLMGKGGKIESQSLLRHVIERTLTDSHIAAARRIARVSREAMAEALRAQDTYLLTVNGSQVFRGAVEMALGESASAPAMTVDGTNHEPIGRDIATAMPSQGTVHEASPLGPSGTTLRAAPAPITRPATGSDGARQGLPRKPWWRFW